MNAPASVLTEPTVTRRQGPWHEQVEGIHVCKLEGDFYAMGRQHGELLGDAVREGPLPYYRTYLERLVGGAHGGAGAKLVWPILRRAVGRRVARGMPDYARETLRGMADGAGLSYQDVLDGCTMPDALMWAAAKSMRLRRIGPAVHHRLALGLGCTSAMAWGDATADGKLLHARNLDYHGVATWPKTAAVLFHQPEHGHRYVSVSAAGVPMGGVTAMNEAGLTLTVHQHMFTDRTRLGGTTIGTVGDEIMRGASSLDEAEAILGRYRPIGCWTYLITDGHRREVLCWEENPDRSAARRFSPEDGTFGYANIYLDPELGRTERALYGSYWRHNQARHTRANGLLEAQRGQLDPAAMAGILGDTGATDCRIHNAIAMLMTVGSVVFRPEDGAFWIGTGEAPTSQGRYLPFSLEKEGYDPSLGELDTTEADPAVRDAFDAYRQGYLAYFDERDLPAARCHLARAIELQPKQALYHFVAGLIDLQRGEPQAAFDALSRALSLGHHDPERVAAFHLWRGRAADVAGRRGEARVDYEAALSRPADRPVHTAAKRGLGRRYKARRARRIALDFAFADVVAP